MHSYFITYEHYIYCILFEKNVAPPYNLLYLYLNIIYSLKKLDIFKMKTLIIYIYIYKVKFA